MKLRLRAVVGAVALALVIAACGDDDAPAVSAELPATAATWALVDAVPAHQKSGVFVRAGLDYEPLLDDAHSQSRARLTLTAPKAMIAMAPERLGLVPFDQVQLGGLDSSIESLDVWLFAIAGEGELTVFVPTARLGDCIGQFSGTEPFAAYGLADDIGGRLAVSSVDCREIDGGGAQLFGDLAADAEVIQSFGALFDTGRDDVDRVDPITLTWLALADTTQELPETTDPLTVSLVNRDVALAARTSDIADDAALATLHVLGSDGEERAVDAAAEGEFVLDLAGLPPRIKLWIDDYGRQHFSRQGAWIDTSRLTRSLVIDFAPEWEVSDESPAASPPNRRPHELRIWNGRREMARQEYEGHIFTNNAGRADRDRSVDNPNDCFRVAYLGGSYVETIQTRVDQKSGIIAEAVLSTRHDRCVEIFTVGQSLFTVESHYANVVSLVEDFGVEQLIFSISGGEMCRMDDLVYEMGNSVARDTPTKWRYLDGEFIAPVSRGDAEVVEADPEFLLSAHCNFSPTKSDLETEQALIEKLGDLADEYAAVGDDLEVVFFLMKDAYVDTPTRIERLDFLTTMCEQLDERCVRLAPPEMFKPEELRGDYSPYLYRWADDGHPNERASQYTAETLAAIVESALLNSEG